MTKLKLKLQTYAETQNCRLCDLRFDGDYEGNIKNLKVFCSIKADKKLQDRPDALNACFTSSGSAKKMILGTRNKRRCLPCPKGCQKCRAIDGINSIHSDFKR